MKKTQHYVGLDVHKDTIMIAVADGGREGEVRLYGQVSSDLHAVERALRKVGADGGELHVAYEAGPTGYVLYRRLRQLDIDCVVVAPSRTPVDKGNRRKTDRRDAQMLAVAPGGVTVRAGGGGQAIRDLHERADAVRPDARGSAQVVPVATRLPLLGQPTGARRTAATCGLELPRPHEGCWRVSAGGHQCEVSRLEQLLGLQAPLWRLYPGVEALMTIRGFQLVAAAVLVAEGDVRRFAHPRELMAFSGWCPGESTGEPQARLDRATRTPVGY
ncbi:transposase [Termitidicoccus mucosus]|uniref:IS110 family transposase n=1 Tax=Termitidicoccus mucosus TaxID=1184151 RepID=UPI00318333B7